MPDMLKADLATPVACEVCDTIIGLRFDDGPLNATIVCSKKCAVALTATASPRDEAWSMPVMLIDEHHGRENGCIAPADCVQSDVLVGGQYRDVYHCDACGLTYTVSAR